MLPERCLVAIQCLERHQPLLAAAKAVDKDTEQQLYNDWTAYSEARNNKYACA